LSRCRQEPITKSNSDDHENAETHTHSQSATTNPETLSADGEGAGSSSSLMLVPLQRRAPKHLFSFPFRLFGPFFPSPLSFYPLRDPFCPPNSQELRVDDVAEVEESRCAAAVEDALGCLLVGVVETWSIALPACTSLALPVAAVPRPPLPLCQPTRSNMVSQCPVCRVQISIVLRVFV
jgi:hypothetical protein